MINEKNGLFAVHENTRAGILANPFLRARTLNVARDTKSIILVDSIGTQLEFESGAKLDADLLGIAGGVAQLGGDGKLVETNLPTSVVKTADTPFEGKALVYASGAWHPVLLSNTNIDAAAGIAWTKIAKAGASASDIGAAASSHTHTTAQVTGLDTALASKEPGLGTPSVTSFLRATAAGVRAWVQLVATDITDLATVLALYLTKNNPNFTGKLSQGGVDRITTTGAGLFGSSIVYGAASDTAGAGPYLWLLDSIAATKGWGAQLGTSSDLMLHSFSAGSWAEKWRFLQDGSLKQAGAVRITTSGGFRGEDIKLTGLIPTTGKMTKIGPDGSIIAATNYDPKGYADIGGNAGTARAGSWTVVLGAELIADADWLDGSSYELKGVIQSESGGYFSTRFSVGTFKTPTIVLPTGTVYVDISVRVIVTGANVQVTWLVTGKNASEVATTKIGTASGAYAASSAHEIVVEINPDPSALVITVASITQRRHT